MISKGSDQTVSLVRIFADHTVQVRTLNAQNESSNYISHLFIDWFEDSQLSISQKLKYMSNYCIYFAIRQVYPLSKMTANN